MAAAEEKVFSDEERMMASHLAALIDRQVQMGVPTELALGVLAGGLGAYAKQEGVSRDQLPIIYGWVEQAYDGATLGASAREADNATGG